MPASLAAGHRIVRASLALLALVCLAPALSGQSSDSAATVVTAAGEVSIVRDGAPWALFADQAVQVGETIVTGENGFAELSLSDGSSFLVYPNSRVVFRKNPGSLRDLLDVFLGRVRFYIQSLGGGPYRYRVFTPTAVISVRGTTFDINVDEDETTLIWVDDGLVGVRHRLLPSNKEVEVAAGQSLVVYPNAPLAKAGMDKVRAVRIAGDIARTAAYIWSRIGRGSGGSGTGVPGTGGSGGGGLPGDTEAPEPPPAPPPGN